MVKLDGAMLVHHPLCLQLAGILRPHDGNCYVPLPNGTESVDYQFWGVFVSAACAIYTLTHMSPENTHKLMGFYMEILIL